MGRHGQDVDHRALDLLPPHDLGGLLHQEEGRAHVDREHAVEQFRARVEDRAAVGDAGGVHQHVDAPERAVGPRGDLARLLDAREVGLHEFRAAALGRDLPRHGLPALRVAAADHEAGGAALGEGAGDGLARGPGCRR